MKKYQLFPNQYDTNIRRCFILVKGKRRSPTYIGVKTQIVFVFLIPDLKVGVIIGIPQLYRRPDTFLACPCTQNARISAKSEEIGVQSTELRAQRSIVGAQSMKLRVQRSEDGVPSTDVGVQRSNAGVLSTKVRSKRSNAGAQSTNVPIKSENVVV
jgi:hypothetical protein